MQKYSISWNALMKQRNIIYGFFAIYILAFHLLMYIGFPNSNLIFKCMRKVLRRGNMGVDIFLFMSAASLCYSLKKNNIRTFYRNRFLRVVPPYLLITVVYYYWNCFIINQFSIGRFWADLSSFGWYAHGEEGELWYMTFIFTAYLIFPLIYKLDLITKQRSTILFIIVAIIIEGILTYQKSPIMETRYETALSRIPVFLSGILFYRRNDKEKGYNALVAFVFVVVGFAYCSVGGLYWSFLPHMVKRYYFGFISICIACVIAFVFDKFSLKRIRKVLNWAGDRSLEVYLTHLTLTLIIAYYHKFNSIAHWVAIWNIIIVCSLIWTIAVRFISDRVSFPAR